MTLPVLHRTLDERLRLEQLLLAALFMYPCAVELEPHDFVSPAHAAFFLALQDTAGAWWGGGFKVVRNALAKQKDDRLFVSVGGTEKFVNEVLPLELAKATMIDLLVGKVRKCHRCGR